MGVLVATGDRISLRRTAMFFLNRWVAGRPPTFPLSPLCSLSHQLIIIDYLKIAPLLSFLLSFLIDSPPASQPLC